MEWTEVEPINVQRIDHSCGLFAFSDGVERVIVAGGQTGRSSASDIRQVEIYDREVK